MTDCYGCDYANVIGTLVVLVAYQRRLVQHDGSFQIYRALVVQLAVDVMATGFAYYFRTWKFGTKQMHAMMMHRIDFALEYSLNLLVLHPHLEMHI